MKKVTFLISSALVATLLLVACKNNSDTSQTSDAAKTEVAQTAAENPIEIIGKTGTITFPLFKVDETFVSDSIVHWKIVDDKGGITESDEKISYKKISENQFFISWIEKSGLTVSQILDAKNQTAIAFVSRADDKSERGKRSSNFFEGTFKIIE